MKDKPFNLMGICMNKMYIILMTGFYLFTGVLAQAAESSSVPANNAYKPGQSERILVLYDNPMEEHTVISVLITRDYNPKNAKQLNSAIEVLKQQAAKLGAHAIIILAPDQNKSANEVTGKGNDDWHISAKAIRYKHFYY